MATKNEPSGADIAAIIERFGGVSPMAVALGVDPGTVQGWKDANQIPSEFHERILVASDDRKLGIGRRDLSGESSLASREIDAAADQPADEAEDHDEDDGEDADAARPRARGAGFATLLAFLALIVAAAALTRDLWAPWFAEQPWAPAAVVTALAPAADPQVAVAQDSVARLSTEIAALRARVDESMPPLGDSGELEAMRDQFDDLRARLDAVASARVDIPGDAPAGAGDLRAALEAGLAEAAAARDALAERIAAVPAPVNVAPAEARIAALESQLATGLDALRAELEAARETAANVDTVARLQTALTDAVSAENAADAALRARLEGLSGRIDAAERAAATLTEAQTDALAAIADLQTASDGMAAADDAALLLAANQLRDAALSGSAFATELEAVERLADPDTLPVADMATLRAAAPLGAPTLGLLRAGFAPAARAAAIAAAEQVEDGDVVDRTLARMRALVVVRPTGAAIEGDDPPARIARAEAALEAEDLAAAVDALSGLDGAPRAAVADWLLAAERRVSVREALSGLTAALVAETARGRP